MNTHAVTKNRCTGVDRPALQSSRSSRICVSALSLRFASRIKDFILDSSLVDGVTEAQLTGLAENVIRVDVTDRGGAGGCGLARRLRRHSVLCGVAGFLQFLFRFRIIGILDGFKAEALLEDHSYQVASADINDRVILFGALNPVLAQRVGCLTGPAAKALLKHVAGTYFRCGTEADRWCCRRFDTFTKT